MTDAQPQQDITAFDFTEGEVRKVPPGPVVLASEAERVQRRLQQIANEALAESARWEQYAKALEAALRPYALRAKAIIAGGGTADDHDYHAAIALGVFDA